MERKTRIKLAIMDVVVFIVSCWLGISIGHYACGKGDGGDTLSVRTDSVRYTVFITTHDTLPAEKVKKTVITF